MVMGYEDRRYDPTSQICRNRAARAAAGAPLLNEPLESRPDHQETAIGKIESPEDGRKPGDFTEGS
jgi:hypothetical protein